MHPCTHLHIHLVQGQGAQQAHPRVELQQCALGHHHRHHVPVRVRLQGRTVAQGVHTGPYGGQTHVAPPQGVDHRGCDFSTPGPVPLQAQSANDLAMGRGVQVMLCTTNCSTDMVVRTERSVGCGCPHGHRARTRLQVGSWENPMPAWKRSPIAGSVRHDGGRWGVCVCG
jgi:hypothetical protein